MASMVERVAERYLTASVRSKIQVSKLPRSVQNALRDAKYPGAKVDLVVSDTYALASPGDDGNRGFTAVVDIPTGHYDLLVGAWGGGGLGVTRPNPVDADYQKKHMPSNTVVVQGQQGGGPYAVLSADAETVEALKARP